MQTTPATYEPYADVRQCDMSVTFRLVDLTAAGEAATIETQKESVSQAAQGLSSNSYDKYATLEYGGWPLDESCGIIPANLSGVNTGFWSVISGAAGTFSINPTLEFDFTSNHSSYGFTLMFDWIYPKTYIIRAYSATNSLINSTTVSCTGSKQVTLLPVTGYRKIVIEFTETYEPYQRVRMQGIIFGVIQEFDKTNIKSGSVLQELVPDASSIPSSELEFTFDNTDRKYNLINPSSLYAYIQQSQPLDVTMAIDSVRVSMGRFYFSKVESTDSSMTAKITAYDRLYQLDKAKCRIGTTGTWTLGSAVSAIIADSGLSIAVSIPAAVASRTVNKCIPTDATHREALRLAAQAARCTCYMSRGDALTFTESSVGAAVDSLDNENMYDYPRITVSERVNQVVLTVKNTFASTETVYTASDIQSGETAQVLSVDNPLAYDGNTVAAWLLSMSQKRRVYSLKERGNPAREIGDTATIYDYYNENRSALITSEEYQFDGGLYADVKGLG